MYIDNSYRSDTLLTGSNGNDTIVNGTYGPVVALAANSNSRVTINALGGNDSIFSDIAGSFRTGEKNSINGGDGDDTIDNDGDKATVIGSAGNDSIRNYGESVRVDAGDGNDQIINQGSKNGQSDPLRMLDSVDKATLIGGAGNDSIYNNGMNVSIDAGDGNDSIDNGHTTNGEKDNVTINAGAGDDYIYNHNDGDYTTILGGAGRDTINNNGDTVRIDGGDGDDTIFSYSHDGTISGGTGNDTVSLDSRNTKDLILYNAGDGNDVINGFKTDSTLQIGNGTTDTFASVKSGSDIIVTAGDGHITLKGAAKLSNVNIAGQRGVLVTGYYYNNTQSNIVIVGNDSANVIDSSYTTNVTIHGNGGNDSIRSIGTQFSISGGDGNDTISHWRSSVTIDGGAGDDFIKNHGSSITISGSTGNDAIYNNWDFGKNRPYDDNDGSNVLFTYNAGDGNDLIAGFKENSTLSISGSGYTSAKSGDDIILTVGDGKITLVGAGKLSKVNIVETPLNLGNSTANTLITGTNLNDYVINYSSGVTVDGSKGNDRIKNNSVNAVRTSLYGGEGNDSLRNYRANNATLNGGEGDDTLSDYSYDSRIIGGKGNDYIYLQDRDQRERIIYNDGDGNDLIDHFNMTTTVRVESGTYATAVGGDNAFVRVGSGIISLRGAGSLPRINVTGTPDTTKNFYNDNKNALVIANDADNSIENNGSGSTILAGGGNDSIHNYSSGRNVTINAGAGNDSIVSYGSNVTISGSTGNDTIYNNCYRKSDGSIYYFTDNDGSNVLIQYNVGDGNDVIYGFKDNSTLSLAGTGYVSSKSGDDIILTVTEGNITLKGAAKLPKVNIVETKLNSTFEKNNISVIGTNYDDTITNTGENVLVIAKDGNDSVINRGKNSTVNGGDGNDLINTEAEGSSIQGGGGNDTLNSYAQNVTIASSTGNDLISLSNSAKNNVIVYNNGDNYDTVRGFKTTSTLNVNGANYASAAVDDDVLVRVGSNVVLTLKSAADLSKINIAGTPDKTKNFSNSNNDTIIIANDADNNISNNADRVKIYALGGNDSINNAWGADTITIEAGDGKDTIQNWGSVMTINAGNGDDYIYNHGGNKNKYDGGSGNDTIISDGSAHTSTILGGRGNDTIKNEGSTVTVSGGVGNDTISNSGNNVVFNYDNGDGSDLINGFNSTSTLNIQGLNYATERSGADVIVYVGRAGEEITLKGAASSKINIRGTEDKRLTIQESRASVSVVGANYSDTITNSGKNVTILGLAGNDIIDNSGANSSVDAGKGNDTITNSYADSVTVDGGFGNDLIDNNRGNKSIIDGEAGNDTIANRASEATIIGGDGNDLLANGDYGNKSIFDGGAGNDTIINTVSEVSISGGAGNDSIDNTDNQHDNNNVTINAGAGNDSIKNDSQNILFQYKNGDGNDVITGFNATSTLSIDGGVRDNSPLASLGGTPATSVKSGNDIVVKVGSGNITLQGAASLSKVNIVETPKNINNGLSNATVYGTNANDTIINTGEKVKIIATEGNDSLDNNAVNVTVDAGKGNDRIQNTGKLTTLTSASGKNTIHSDADSVSIAGGADADSIFSDGEKVTITGGAGNDTIQNNTDSSYVSIDGGAGNDSIKTESGHNVTIAGGAGEDTIFNQSGTAVSIDGGAGNDLISLNGTHQNTIFGGRGDDTINVDRTSTNALILYTPGNGTTINPGDGNDLVEGFSATSTLQIGDGTETYTTETVGDDVIVTVADSNITLKGAAKLDHVNIKGATQLNVNNVENGVSLLGSRLNDSVVNHGFKVSIQTYAGYDTVHNFARRAVIDGGNDADYIESRSANFVTIDAGAGDDRIVNQGGVSDTITPGKGNDSLDVSRTEKVLVKYKAGDGNDYIEGFNETSSLRISDGVFTSEKNGNDIIVTVGEDKITLQGAANLSKVNIIGVEDVHFNVSNEANNTLLVGTIFEDTIGNSGNNVTIIGQAGNDSIHNGSWEELAQTASNVTIDAGAGDDSIWNESGSTVSIEAGEGNDYIENRSTDITVNGGAGNDKIFNTYTGFKSSLSGGAGNDSIDNKAQNMTIAGGKGNDTIYNNWDIKNNRAFNDDNGEGSNVLFEYKTGDGNDVIYGFKYNSTLRLYDGNDTYSTQKSGNDVIVTVKDGKITLKGADDLKKVNIVDDVPLNINNTVSNTLIVGTDANDTIRNSGEDVTIQAAGGNDTINNSGADSVIDMGEGNDTVSNAANHSTVNADSGNDRIYNGGYMAVIDAGEGNDTIESNGKNSTITGGKGNDSIQNRQDNMTFVYNKGDGNDIITGFRADSTLKLGGGNDSYSARTSGNDIIVTFGDGNITLAGAATLHSINILGVPRIIVEDSVDNRIGNALIIGDDSANTIKNSGTNVTIQALGGNDSIDNLGANSTIDAGAGDDSIRNEIGAQNVSINAGDGYNYIENHAANVTIKGGVNDDTISNAGSNSIILSGAGDDSIRNSGDSVSVEMSDGDDFISNRGNNATITGGVGDDYVDNSGDNALFIYNVGDGNDVISGFKTNSTLSIVGGVYSSTTKSGDDVIVTIGEDKITLKGAASLSTVNIAELPVTLNNSANNVALYGSNGNDSIDNSGANVTIKAKDGNDIIGSNAASAIIDGGAGNDSISNPNKGDNSTIIGGEGNDSIYNAGSNVTITAGEGNDSIYNNWDFENNRPYDDNDGSNVLFQYTAGDGNDLITGFRADSTLKIGDGSDTYSTQKSGDNVIVKVGNENITLAGAATLSAINILGDEKVLPVTINNTVSNTLIVGTVLNDSISNRGNNVSIEALDGDDTIRNYNSNVTINGGAGNDSLFNYRDGTNSLLLSGEGNDSIANGQAQATLEGEAGDDYIYNDGNTVTIAGGTGDDFINNNTRTGYGDNVVFVYNAGDGNDSIVGFKANSTLSIIGDAYSSAKSGDNVIVTVGEENITLAGAAKLSAVNILGEKKPEPLTLDNSTSNTLITGTALDDTIDNSGANVTIQALGGNDSLYNGSSSSVKIDGGSGNDRISNSGSKVTIDAGDDNDKIYNYGTNSSVEGGADNDSIFNDYSGRYTTIVGGAGNDSIWNYGSNVTISGGQGNDTIKSYDATGVVFQYTAGDGNDYIVGVKADSTLSISGDSYSTTGSGGNVIVTVGEDKITLTAAGLTKLSTVNIIGEKKLEPLTLNNSTGNTLITGTALNDSISNYSSKVTINGGEGDDSIYNAGSNSSVEGGTGNDSIYNTANYDSTINGGEGADTISNAGFRANVEGNAGDDYIQNTGWDISITGGAGNDTVSLGSGSKNELIIYNAGDGSDVINGFNTTSTLSISGDVYSSTKSGSDIIVTVGEENITLVGAANLSTVNIAGTKGIKVDGKYDNSLGNVMLVGNDANNSIKNTGSNVTIAGNDGNDSIYNNLGSNVSINGGAGNDYAWNSKDSVTIAGGAGNDSIRNEGEKVTILGGVGNDSIDLLNRAKNNLIVYNAGDGNDTVIGFKADSTLQIGDGTGIYSSQKSGSDIIVTVGEENITLKNAANLSSVNIIGEKKPKPLSLYNAVNNILITGTAFNDSIYNSGSNVTIAALGGNDSIRNNGRDISITGGAGNDTVSLGSGSKNELIVYNAGDGSDVINGFNTTSTLSISGDVYSSTKSGSDIIVTVGEENITLKNAANLSAVNIAGTAGIKVDGNYNNSQSNVLLVGNDSANTILNSGSGENVTILANGGNDSITNWNKNVSIEGGAGNDTVWSRAAANTTISGGAGNDSIRHDNFGDNSKLDGGEGNDDIYSQSSNVTMNGGDGDDTISNYGSYTTELYKVRNSIASDIVINGNDGNDFIEINNTSNVTISGGDGNDTIGSNWRFNYNIPNTSNGGGSNLLFQYKAGEGNDVIYGFNSTSTLSITGASYSSAKSGDDVIVTVGDGNITLKNAASLSTVRIAFKEETPLNVSNSTGNVSIIGTSLNDTIANSGSNVTIKARGGDDSIQNSADNVLFRHAAGDGNDSIIGFNANSTLDIYNAKYISTTSGDDVIVSVGAENIILAGAASLSAVNILGVEETPLIVENKVSDTLIVGTVLNDSISNRGNNVSIEALDGDDTIRNYNSNVTINGGAGNDSLFNYRDGTNSLLLSGEGNDSIANGQAQATLEGEVGDDYIYNDGNTVTIAGGKGNDVINNNNQADYGKNVVFKYNKGDGNDLITGFKADSTLQLGDGTGSYSTQTIGDDIIVYFGDGNITLKGAATLSKVNINGVLKSVIGSGNNKVSNISLIGTEADDTIVNSGTNVTIDALGGNDSISNSGDSVTIEGGAGNDTLWNDVSGSNRAAGKNVSLNGGEGSDVISNDGEGATILGGADNDSIQNYGASSKIDGGTGDDSVQNVADSVTIDGGAGNDTLWNDVSGSNRAAGKNVSLNGGEGSDVISNDGEGATILGGADNDSIQNYGANSEIDGGAGADTVYNEGASVTLTGGAGNDSIWNRSGNKVTISGGSGDDTIANNYYGSTVSIDAGAGNDSVWNDDSDVTITGGDGKDTIRNFSHASNALINSGNDNDYIINSLGANAIINAGAGDDSIYNSGYTVSIDAGDGNDSITNGYNKNGHQDNVTLNAGAGDDYIYNHTDGDYTTILGGAGRDTVNNNGDTISIDGGEGDDSIFSYSVTGTVEGGAGNDIISLSGNGNNNLVDGGAGKDTINNQSSNSTILGGDGVDSISNSGANVTINAGADDDTITNSGANVLFQYKLRSGNDVINGFREDSTLKIGSGSSTYSTQKSGNDIIVTVGEGNITLKGAATLSALNIFGTPRTKAVTNADNKTDNTLIIGNDLNNKIINRGANVTIQANGGKDSIDNYGSSVTISCGKGNDSVYNNLGVSNVTIDGGAGNDSIDNKGTDITINGGDGDDTIWSNDRYVTINGDSDSDTIYSGMSSAYASLNGGAGNDSIISRGVYSTITGGAGDDTVTIAASGQNALIVYTAGDGNDSIVGFNETSTLSIAGAGYTSTKSGSDIFFRVGEGVITLKGAASLSKLNIAGVESRPLTTVNYADDISLVGTPFNDTLENYGTNVTIVALEDNDFITNKALNTSILNGDGSDTVVNIGSNATMLGEAGNDSVNNYGNYAIIDMGAGDDTISNSQFGKNSSLTGGDGNDYIDNWASYSTLNGGLGNDTLRISLDAANALIEYKAGDGNDLVEGFRTDSSLSIASGIYESEVSGADILVTIGDEKITLAGAATIAHPNIIGEQKVTIIANDDDGVTVFGTEGNDTITNDGESVTVLALGGDDSIDNGAGGDDTSIDAGAGDDTIVNEHTAQDVTISANDGNDYIFSNGNYNLIDGGAGRDTVKLYWDQYSSINGAEGNDVISIEAGSDLTVTAGEGDDTIWNDSSKSSRRLLIQYEVGDGNDLVKGFKEDSTLSIGSNNFSKLINGDDIIVSVEEHNITLEGAAKLNAPNIIGTTEEEGTYVAFTVAGSEVTYETDGSEAVINKAYRFNEEFSLLTLKRTLRNYIVTVENKEEDSVKVNWHFGAASLSSASVLKYRLDDEENVVTLTSKNYSDKVTFDEDATFNYGAIKADVVSGSVLTTKDAKEISFDNDSSADVTAPEGSQINIDAGTFTFNNLSVKSTSGEGAITVERDGLTFKGYGAQFIDLEIAKESYFGKLTPMTAAYKTSDKSYAIQNTAVVKTRAHDFTKIMLSFRDGFNADDKYAYYKVNDKEFLVSNDADNLNVIEAKGNNFKVQGKELDAEKISRVTIDERINFKGTEINFDDVKTNYAQDKTASYSLDGKEVSISEAATVTTSGESKNFTCAAGSYVINGKSFETTANLTFTTDASKIKIPLTDAAAEIFFDGVKVSGVSDGGELVFDLAKDKTFVPDGATINVSSAEEVKLNLAAGTFTINDNKISSSKKLEIAADKDNINVPLGNAAVTINGAKITGTDAAIINQKMIALPDGALVQNVSDNLFKLNAKNSTASFGNANKKVQLTEDATAYIKFAEENTISVGFNSVIFENVKVQGNDAWTVETSGANGIDKIKDIKSNATISASLTAGAKTGLQFDVETEGKGTFTICGKKFTSTGDAENIFTVSKSLETSNSNNAVTAVTKKLGTVSGNFEEGINVNPQSDSKNYLVKATNNDKDVEIASDSSGVISIASIAGGANVEKYGQAEKIITVKNDAEYSLQIDDYKYTVNGDLDDDGITFELVDGDFKVRTLFAGGLVTRNKVSDEQDVWTWSIDQDKWIQQQDAEVPPYEITINANKTLTLKANGNEIAPYPAAIISSPKSGSTFNKNITVTTAAIDRTTNFINNSKDMPNILVGNEEIISALAANAAVKVDNNAFTLQSESSTGTTFKLDATRNTHNLADDFKVTYVENSGAITNVKLTSDNNDLSLSNRAAVTAPAGKGIEFAAGGDYSVNAINFNVTSGTKAETVERGVKFNLSTGKVQYDGLTLEGTGTAQITNYNPDVIALTDGAIVTAGEDPFSYYNRDFLIEGDVKIVDKQFRSDKQVDAGLVYFQTSNATLNPDGTYESETITTTGFVVENKYVNIQNDCYDFVNVVDGKIATIEGVKASADISGEGIQNVSILTDGGGLFTINGKTYDVKSNSVGVIFQTDSSGNVSNIKWQRGTVTANFENAISINDKVVQVTGANEITVEGNETGVTEISNVAGDLISSDNKTYRKDVQIYQTGGAKKLTTAADGKIIFNGNKFETSAGKTFTLDTLGNVSEIGKAKNENAIVSANVAELETSKENFATIALSTTDGLEEVIGDFSEGITINGVLVKVTDSTNFVVKDDDENVYIETTAAGTFTINGKTFKTEADKTIFKLDADGKVCEIVTDTFFPDAEAYLIKGDFTDEIIFNGKKFCVKGINDASIFIGDETMISVKLANSAVEIAEDGGATELVVNGNGDLILGDKNFSISNNFAGILKMNSAGDIYSSNYFRGTISGKLGGLELAGITIDSEDSFSVTGNGEKISAIENLQSGSFTCGDLSSMTINGAKLNVNNLEDVKITVTDGELKVSELMNNATVTNRGEKVNFVTKENGEFFIGEDEFKVTGDSSIDFEADSEGKVQKISELAENASVQTALGGQFVVNSTTLNAKDEDTFIGLANGSAKISGYSDEFLNKLVADNSDAVIVNTNVTLEADSLAIVEDSASKVSITASAGEDTIYTAGKYVDIDLKAGGATKIYAVDGRATIENYDAKTGAAFIAENFAEEIAEKAIAYDDGRLNINSAIVTFDDDATSKLINFVDADGATQRVGFASDSSELDAGKETANLILVGGIDSTLRGGKGKDTIYSGEGNLINAGAGRNLIELGGEDAIIELSGNTTVTGFNDSDALKTSTDNLKLQLDGENLIAKNNSATITLEDVTENTFAQISIIDGAETLKAYVAQDDENIFADETADLYYGKKSGVDFSNCDENLMLNLAGDSFVGINRVTLGSGLNTLFSSSRNETLTSSEGTTQFIFNAGAGHDVIQNFNFAEDKISVGSAVSNVVLRNSGDVIVQLGDEWITLEDAQGKSFRINDFVAQVDENISYDDETNYFLASSRNASVIVNEEAEVWLDGSHGKNFVGNIRTLDASTSDGKNTLAGNDLDNTIRAGAGDASLWGGNGGDDLLVGGKAHNLFFYCAGNGNDTIQGTNDGDTVILSTVTLDQISGTSITANGLSISFVDGGTLQVEGNSDVTYQLADGSQFSANHEQSIWLSK